MKSPSRRRKPKEMTAWEREQVKALMDCPYCRQPLRTLIWRWIGSQRRVAVEGPRP